jgi:hypothetical protein
MKVLCLTLGVLFLITFLAAPMMGAGWYWDAGNGLGFAAFAGLLYLGITSFRRLDVRAHQVFGYAVLGVAVVHALWFLLGDAAAIEFVKIGAPDYMWLGIVGLLLLFVLVTIALVPDRLQVHKDYPAFRYWHRILAVTTVACCTYHIVVSNFYLAAWYQSLLFVMTAIVATSFRSYWIKLGQIKIATPTAYIVISVLISTLFSAIRNLPL